MYALGRLLLRNPHDADRPLTMCSSFEHAQQQQQQRPAEQPELRLGPTPEQVTGAEGLRCGVCVQV